MLFGVFKWFLVDHVGINHDLDRFKSKIASPFDYFKINLTEKANFDRFSYGLGCPQLWWISLTS